MINVGIIGFGRIGAEHAGWLQRSAGIGAVAVFDPTPARRDLALQRGLRVFASLDELLGDDQIDAVLISTPTAFHFDQAKAAIAAGRHVMIEKPMAMNLPQAKELAHLAEQNGVVLSVFHNRRWDADYLTIRSLIHSGTLGRVFNIESRLGQWASCVGPAAREYRPGWRNEAAYGGGGLFDWGSHFVDQLWRLFWPARPASVFAQLRGNVWSTDCDDFARVCINFDSGAMGMVEINTTTTMPMPRWHIDASGGSAQGPASLSFDLETWASVRMRTSVGKESMAPRAGKGLSESQIWERFAGAITQKTSPAVTARSVLATMLLLDAARRSSEKGIAIDIGKDELWDALDDADLS